MIIGLGSDLCNIERIQAALDRPLPAGALLTPVHGAFNRAVEVVLTASANTALTGWKEQ